MKHAQPLPLGHCPIVVYVTLEKGFDRSVVAGEAYVLYRAKRPTYRTGPCTGVREGQTP